MCAAPAPGLKTTSLYYYRWSGVVEKIQIYYIIRVQSAYIPRPTSPPVSNDVCRRISLIRMHARTLHVDNIIIKSKFVRETRGCTHTPTRSQTGMRADYMRAWHLHHREWPDSNVIFNLIGNIARVQYYYCVYARLCCVIIYVIIF